MKKLNNYQIEVLSAGGKGRTCLLLGGLTVIGSVAGAMSGGFWAGVAAFTAIQVVAVQEGCYEDK